MEVYEMLADARLLMGPRFVAVALWDLIQRGRGSVVADVPGLMAKILPGEAMDEKTFREWLRQLKANGVIELEQREGAWMIVKGRGKFSLTNAPAKKKSRKAAAPASPEVLAFPTRGTSSTWSLTEAMVEEWVALFPGVDVLQCCRGALAWVMADVRHQKTARGMKAFLVSWLNRQVEINSRGNGGGFGGRDDRTKMRGDLSRALAEFGVN